MLDRSRVLFVTENVTLAQVVRLAALAERVDPELVEVHFACSDFDPRVFRRSSFRCWTIGTVDAAGSLRKAEQGRRIYDFATLRRYVEEELALFDRVRPDLVVGDFRLSLSVSAALARVPQATLINAYWSPHAVRDGFPLPEHPLVSVLGVKLAARFFPLAAPFAFARFAEPVNALRRYHGLPAIGDLLDVLSYGDYTLYPDVPELCPTRGLGAQHRYLGAIPWSPEVELCDRAAELVHGPKPFVYVTLGSSGRVQVLGSVLEALASLGLRALVATAGRLTRGDVSRLGANACVVDFVPGHLAARAARFVVTNGGSSSGYQALIEGKPVLGIPCNLDQYLASTAIEKAGAGRLVRAGGVTPATVREAASDLLLSSSFHERALELARAFARYDCHERFASFSSQALARRYDHAANRRPTAAAREASSSARHDGARAVR